MDILIVGGIIFYLLGVALDFSTVWMVLTFNGVVWHRHVPIALFFSSLWPVWLVSHLTGIYPMEKVVRLLKRYQ